MLTSTSLWLRPCAIATASMTIGARLQRRRGSYERRGGYRRGRRRTDRRADAHGTRREGDARRALVGDRRQRLVARGWHARAVLRGRERATRGDGSREARDRLVGRTCAGGRARGHAGPRPATRRRRDRAFRQAHFEP